uniref:Glycoprotein hormone alpha-2.2 n=1 Tax=Ophionotus victoriae TaxID=667017 RepID=A0A220W0E0_9ECHI|nr:glycoprotein hormone alpha-2.2 precursor [Ophionotus victoriae]
MGEDKDHRCTAEQTTLRWKLPSFWGIRIYALFLLCFYLVFSCILCPPVSSADNSALSWKKPGCHLVGYTKEVKIPGCYTATVAMNACRGFCMTYSFPSDKDTLDRSNGDKYLTSHGSCCTIKSTHDVHVTLQCENDHQYRDTFKSAAKCDCAICDQSD